MEGGRKASYPAGGEFGRRRPREKMLWSELSVGIADRGPRASGINPWREKKILGHRSPGLILLGAGSVWTVGGYRGGLAATQVKEGVNSSREGSGGEGQAMKIHASRSRVVAYEGWCRIGRWWKFVGCQIGGSDKSVRGGGGFRLGGERGGGVGWMEWQEKK